MASLLLKGERLVNPRHCPATVGDLMASCWKGNPDERPTFEQCEQALGDLLDPNVRAQYKRSYDRYGYIVMASNQPQATHSEINQRQARGEYLDVIADTSV